MQGHLEHTIPRELRYVEATLLSEAFPARLAAASSCLAEGTLLSVVRSESIVVRRAHFRVGGAAKVGPLGRFGEVGWTEEVTWDTSTHSAIVTVVPDLPTPLIDRIHCEATYTLSPLGHETVRAIDVTIVVDWPLVGERVAARVFGLLRDVFDDEARLLAE